MISNYLFSEQTAEAAVETAAEEETEASVLLVEEITEKVSAWEGISIGDLLNTYVPSAIDFALRVILALVIFAIGRKIIDWITRWTDRLLERRGVELTVRHFLKYVIIAAGYILLAMILLETMGIAATSLAAVFASAGVAIGLALQGSLSNFAGGILILLMKPFVIGDYIVQGDNEGTVKEIGLVYTKLLTIDNRMILIPNGTLSDNSVINVTANPIRRLDLTVGISYESDLLLAKNILTQLAEDEPERIEDQDITVFVSELGESSVVLGLRLWIPTDKYWEVKWRMTEQIKLQFDASGVEIPYNQLDVHMREGKNSSASSV